MFFFFVNQGTILLNEEFLIFVSLVLLFVVLFNALSKTLKFFMFSNVEKIYFTFLYAILVNININNKIKFFFNYLFIDFYYFISYEFIFSFYYFFVSFSSLYYNLNLNFLKNLNNFIFQILSSFSFNNLIFDSIYSILKTYFLNINSFNLRLCKFINLQLLSNTCLNLFIKNFNIKNKSFLSKGF